MSRQPFVCGNWKMYSSAASAKALAAGVIAGVKDDAVKVGISPPFAYLPQVVEVVKGSHVVVGAQNCYPKLEGAFTGEVSPAMIEDVGCQFVILGHSERRHGLGETNQFINQKVKTVLETKLSVILCIGETLTEREANKTEAVVGEQLRDSLAGIPESQYSRIVLAYEPVWAIGTGRNATPQQAQDVHAFIRKQMASQVSVKVAEQLIIQYGGSVKPENAREIMSQPDVDGALVGGASLKADSFLAIVQGARK